MSRRYADAVLEALLATLKKANGAGDYLNDLTATGNQPARVYKGFYETPPVAPSAPTYDGGGDLDNPGRPVVCAYFNGSRVQQGDSMQTFSVEASFIVKGWVAGSPRGPGTRIQNAADLFNDLNEALETNIHLTHTSTTLPGYSSRNLVRSLEWDGVPFDGDGNASQKRYGQQFGEVMLVVLATWREARPTQTPAA